MAKKGYVAVRGVSIGFGDEDPDRPGRQLVETFETGEPVSRAGELPNLDALIAAGYIAEATEVPTE